MIYNDTQTPKHKQANDSSLDGTKLMWGASYCLLLELRTGLRYTDVPVFLYGTRTGISFLPYRIRTV